MRRQKRSKRPFILLLSLIIMIFGSLYLFKGFFKKDNGTNDNNDNDNNNNIVENVKERSITFTLAGNVLLNAEMWYDTASDGQYNFEYVFEDINNIINYGLASGAVSYLIPSYECQKLYFEYYNEFNEYINVLLDEGIIEPIINFDMDNLVYTVYESIVCDIKRELEYEYEIQF